MFKKRYFYLKIFTDKLELTDLSSGQVISTPPGTKFSSSRSVIGNVGEIMKLARELVSEMAPGSRLFSAERRMLVQQMEDLEGGPSQIEERALRDIGEMAGVGYVILKVASKELSMEEARKLL